MRTALLSSLLPLLFACTSGVSNGAGNCPDASDPDVLYDSIVEVPAAEETVVGLQFKYLFLLNLVQGADARPTPQAARAAERLDEAWRELEKRF